MQITHCRPAPSWAAPRAPHAALRCAALLRAPPVRPERPQQHGVFVPVGKPRLRFAGAAAVGVSDGINTQKPSLMADTLEQHVPPPPISKTDEQFVGEGVEFVWGADGIDIDELNALFEKVGFPRRDPARLAQALGATYRTLWIRSARKSRLARQGALLGFARATSDGALSAVIWDVAVAPAWQRGGLGRGLMERLTASLVEDGIATITLYAEPNVVSLYEKLGFVADPDGIRGVAYQSKSATGRALAAGGLRR